MNRCSQIVLVLREKGECCNRGWLRKKGGNMKMWKRSLFFKVLTGYFGPFTKKHWSSKLALALTLYLSLWKVQIFSVRQFSVPRCRRLWLDLITGIFEQNCRGPSSSCRDSNLKHRLDDILQPPNELAPSQLGSRVHLLIFNQCN